VGTREIENPFFPVVVKLWLFSFIHFFIVVEKRIEWQREIRVVIVVVVVVFFLGDSLLILHSLLSCKFWRSVMQVMILESELRLCFVE
jgi:hypothetical protein